MNIETTDELTSLTFQPSTLEIGKRLDAYLAQQIENRSRSRIQKMIDGGDVLVNEKQVKSSYKIQNNDTIEVELSELPADVFEPENISLDIVYEDEFLAVINKPAGMVVHPGAGISNGTLANAIAFHFGFGESDREFNAKEIVNPQLATPNRVGIVHRLDKDTSGLIVVAKDEKTHEALSEQFHDRTVYKRYLALVHGEFDENTGTIDAPIAREKHNRTKMGVRGHGRNALSLWRVKERFEKFTLLEVEIKTGRTHQIRVHLAHIHHPVVGDETYNNGRDKTVANPQIRKAIQNLNRFFLHAEKLSFTHPQTNEKMSFRSSLPKELTEFLELL